MAGIDPTLVWAGLLLLLGLGCIVLEMFVPSGGLLGVMAVLSIVAAVVLAFLAGPLPGIIMTLVVTFLIPLVLAGAVRYWPDTPLGRTILLRRPESNQVLPQTEAYQTLHFLIGKQGVAKSRMLLSGVVSVDGKAYDAVSNGLPIDAGDPVRVIATETQRLVVRIDAAPFREETPVAAADDGLSRPFNETSLPGVEDPFA